MVNLERLLKRALRRFVSRKAHEQFAGIHNGSNLSILFGFPITAIGPLVDFNTILPF